MNLNFLLCFGLWNFIRSVASFNLTALLDGAVSIVDNTINEAEFLVELTNNTLYTQYDPAYGEEFDFIVIGAGSAGSVVANRLSENSNWTVLVLEAGGDPTIISEIPGVQPLNLHTEIDWAYKLEPDSNYCLSSVNGSCYYPRGKVMGGTSTLNAMYYIRGNPRDYDEWFARGNDGWFYEDVLPYFKKLEDFVFNGTLTENDVTYHGFDGYQKVSPYPKHPFTDSLSSILGELGLNSYSDVNENNYLGFFELQGTLFDSTRQSSAKSYIKPVQGRENLKLSKNSFATKLLIDSSTNAVYGVEFCNQNEETVVVTAKKEVILSAGSINSPQLLMLSGIGPREHLEDLDINLIQDLPVGKNLQDHIFPYGIVYSLNVNIPYSITAEEIYKYFTSTSDVLGGIGLLSNAALINLSSTDYPDVEAVFFMINANDSFTLQTYFTKFQVNEAVIASWQEILTKSTLLFVLPFIYKPKSVGEILLNSNNPFDYPKIHPNYFSNEEDLELYLKAFRYFASLADTETMQSFGAKLQQVSLPSCDQLEFESDDYWICVLRHLGLPVYHPVGTCKMGLETDNSSVVDPRLRVIGVDNLRVVDASIMTTIVSGHPNAAAMMIGEKGSDMIKEDWV